MLRLNVEKLKDQIAHFNGFQTVGKLLSAQGVITARLPASVRELCRLQVSSDKGYLAEVIGFDRSTAQIMSFDTPDSLPLGTKVIALHRTLRVPCGDPLLGRVIDAMGKPLDQRGPISSSSWREIHRQVPSPLERTRISDVFLTGQRVIDGLITCGRGQRLGLFAGSGVGKSTLLGEIAKGSQSDVNVVVLVGERGREVRPFVEDSLGPDGLLRSVVVVSTSDETPLKRIRAVETAITIANDFRQRGANVLFLLDSLTRLATAQRELGLSLGEPPSARGYPPSVFQMLSRTLEQLGNSSTGTITAILTVLVDGDDMNEPIADSVRSIVDGHITLTRQLAERGHFPAVDVSQSLSRVFREIAAPSHQKAAQAIRHILATHAEVADLLRVGAYVKGTSPQVDRAVDLLPTVNAVLTQPVDSRSTLPVTLDAMQRIAAQWPFVT